MNETTPENLFNSVLLKLKEKSKFHVLKQRNSRYIYVLVVNFQNSNQAQGLVEVAKALYWSRGRQRYGLCFVQW